VSERISSLSRLVILLALQFGDRFVTRQADIPKSGPAAIENSNDRHAAVTVLDPSGLEHAQLDQPALFPAARVSTLATACRMLTTLAPPKARSSDWKIWDRPPAQFVARIIPSSDTTA